MAPLILVCPVCYGSLERYSLPNSALVLAQCMDCSLAKYGGIAKDLIQKFCTSEPHLRIPKATGRSTKIDTINSKGGSNEKYNKACNFSKYLVDHILPT